MKERKLEDVVVHEVGHAFTAIALGGAVLSMEARGGGGEKPVALGKTVSVAPMFDAVENLKLWKVMVSLSGAAAESVLAGREKAVNECGADLDFEDAVRQMRGLPWRLVHVWDSLVAGFSAPEVATAIRAAAAKLVEQGAPALPAREMAHAVGVALRDAGGASAVEVFRKKVQEWTRN